MRLRSDIDDALLVASPKLRFESGPTPNTSVICSSARSCPVPVRSADVLLDGTIHLTGDAAAMVRSHQVPRPATKGADRLRRADRLSVAKLVLDGILQIEANGRFVSGMDALPRLCVVPPRGLIDTTGEPSRSALEYASALLPLRASDLAARLYRYGAMPCSARWLARVPDRSAVAAHLRFGELTRCAGIVENRWVVHAPGSQTEWLTCRRRSAARGRNCRRRLHKLYLGVGPPSLAEALHAAELDQLWREAIAFKVAAAPHGLLRVDKCVAYFDRRAALEDTCRAVARAVTSASLQPVPFAEACPSSRALWWSCDPTYSKDATTRTSSRYQICALLAFALAIASRAREACVSPVDFALLRLSLDGWDLRTFTKRRGRRR